MADSKVSSQANAINMQEVSMKRTELGFVTAIHRPTRTFFLQLCCNTNQDLLDFNENINNYCTKAKSVETKDSQESRLRKKAHKGELICALFDGDQRWYRALILGRDKENKSYSVVFVDYGNVEIVGPDDLVFPDPKELPVIERCPFGTTCFIRGIEALDKDLSNFVLDCLKNNYVMVKLLERQSKVQWAVEIPKHAYNSPFWLLMRNRGLISFNSIKEESGENNEETASQ